MTEFTMMDGSSSDKSYLAVARRGNVVFGFKPTQVAQGSMIHGIQNTTYVGFRFRASYDSKLFKEKEKEEGVSLLPIKYSLTDAWPAFTFKKVNHDRASSDTGILLEGTPVLDPDFFAKLTKDDKFYLDLCAYLEKIVSGGSAPPTMVHTTEEIVAWVKSVLQPVFDTITEGVKNITLKNPMGKSNEVDLNVFGADIDTSIKSVN